MRKGFRGNLSVTVIDDCLWGKEVLQALETIIPLSSESMSKGRFEDLSVWKDAMSLAELVFVAFAECKQYSLKKQIERASMSISTNIAEGFEQGTSKNFVRYLYIAKGSCGEVRSLLRLALRLSLISEERAEELINKCIYLSVSIYKLISSKYKN